MAYQNITQPDINRYGKLILPCDATGRDGMVVRVLWAETYDTNEFYAVEMPDESLTYYESTSVDVDWS